MHLFLILFLFAICDYFRVVGSVRDSPYLFDNEINGNVNIGSQIVNNDKVFHRQTGLGNNDPVDEELLSFSSEPTSFSAKELPPGRVIDIAIPRGVPLGVLLNNQLQVIAFRSPMSESKREERLRNLASKGYSSVDPSPYSTSLLPVSLLEYSGEVKEGDMLIAVDDIPLWDRDRVPFSEIQNILKRYTSSTTSSVGDDQSNVYIVSFLREEKESMTVENSVLVPNRTRLIPELDRLSSKLSKIGQPRLKSAKSHLSPSPVSAHNTYNITVPLSAPLFLLLNEQMTVISTDPLDVEVYISGDVDKPVSLEGLSPAAVRSIIARRGPLAGKIWPGDTIVAVNGQRLGLPSVSTEASFNCRYNASTFEHSSTLTAILSNEACGFSSLLKYLRINSTSLTNSFTSASFFPHQTQHSKQEDPPSRLNDQNRVSSFESGNALIIALSAARLLNGSAGSSTMVTVDPDGSLLCAAGRCMGVESSSRDADADAAAIIAGLKKKKNSMLDSKTVVSEQSFSLSDSVASTNNDHHVNRNINDESLPRINSKFDSDRYSYSSGVGINKDSLDKQYVSLTLQRPERLPVELLSKSRHYTLARALSQTVASKVQSSISPPPDPQNMIESSRSGEILDVPLLVDYSSLLRCNGKRCGMTLPPHFHLYFSLLSEESRDSSHEFLELKPPSSSTQNKESNRVVSLKESLGEFEVTVEAVSALFGGTLWSCIPKRVVFVGASEGCSALSLSRASKETAIKGSVLITDRGVCEFPQKAKLAQDFGATSLIVINSDSSAPFAMPGKPNISPMKSISTVLPNNNPLFSAKTDSRKSTSKSSLADDIAIPVVMIGGPEGTRIKKMQATFQSRRPLNFFDMGVKPLSPSGIDVCSTAFASRFNEGMEDLEEIRAKQAVIESSPVSESVKFTQGLVDVAAEKSNDRLLSRDLNRIMMERRHRSSVDSQRSDQSSSVYPSSSTNRIDEVVSRDSNGKPSTLASSHDPNMHHPFSGDDEDDGIIDLNALSDMYLDLFNENFKEK